MNFTIRFDSWKGQHVLFTVFGNGANCGQLCMTVDEYRAFVAMLLIGQATCPGAVKIKSDDKDFRAQALEQTTTEGGEPTVEAGPLVYARMLLDQRGKR